MKIIILKSNLKEGLTAVERAVANNPSLPILKNVLIKTNNNKINLCTTNLELAVTKNVSGKIIEEGGLTVPFQVFYNIINNADQEKINLQKDKNNFIVKTDNYEAKLQSLKEDEFPVIPQLEKTDGEIEINSGIFKKAISSIIQAACISEIRPEISGILIDYQITQIKLAATDSFRLAEKTIDSNQFKSTFNYAFKVIVPLQTVQEVVRVFNFDQPLKIQLDDNQILFKGSDLEIISRLINGNYPDYEQIIPKSVETELTLNRNYFINALKLVSVFSGKNNEVNLAVRNGKVLDVYLRNQMLGENNYLIPVKTQGPDFQDVAFNWRFLLDGLKSIEGETVIFGLNGSSKPAIIKSPQDNSLFYILMPIKS